MSWEDVLKAPPFIDTKDSSDPSPMVFINDPLLPKERWDRNYKRSHGKNKDQTTTTYTEKNIEISNYGRVKIDWLIQKPKQRGQKVVTEIEGDVMIDSDYKTSGGSFAHNITSPKQGKSYVPYGVTVSLLRGLNYDIPDNAEILNSPFKTYKELKENIRGMGAEYVSHKVDTKPNKEYYMERIKAAKKRLGKRKQPHTGVSSRLKRELAEARKKFKEAGGTQKELDEYLKIKMNYPEGHKFWRTRLKEERDSKRRQNE